MTSHAATNLAQYDSQAEAYLHSAIHAAGPDLAYACQQVATQVGRPARALDVGCGSGAQTLFLNAERIIATDIDSRALEAANMSCQPSLS